VAGIDGLKIYISDRRHGNMSLTNFKSIDYLNNNGKVSYYFRQAATYPRFYGKTILNRYRFLRTLGLDLRKAFCPTLGLTDEIQVINKRNWFMFEDSGTIFKSRTRCDAVITNIADLALMFNVADCPVVHVYDARKIILGKIHSGRVNTLKNITGKTVQKMKKKFSCKEEDMIATFASPFLRACCNFMFYLGFNEQDPEIQKIMPALTEVKGGWMMDLQEAINIQLRAEGVRNIVQSDLNCTLCGGEHFSHRGWQTRHPDHPLPGRFAVVSMMTNF
jgi:copper oxidase (laccase) domain-containing protein